MSASEMTNGASTMGDVTPKLKHLQPEQYKSWLRKATDPEWDEEKFGCSTRSKPERAAASMALELRDAFDHIVALQREIATLRAPVTDEEYNNDAFGIVSKSVRKGIDALIASRASAQGEKGNGNGTDEHERLG